jgi:uncharacterized protein YjiS (DUF1127 family)
MATYTPVLPIAASTTTRVLASLAAVFVKRAAAIARALRHRRQAMALSGLDSYMLKDIGITRADLNDAFSSPIWEDPTALLRERAIERRVNRPAPFGKVTLQPQSEAEAEEGFVRPRLDRPSHHAI